MSKSRNTTASQSFILVLSLSFLYLSSFLVFNKPQTHLNTILETLAQKPFNPRLHMQLAEIYYTLGNLLQAQTELDLTSASQNFYLFSHSYVLGETSEQTTLQTKILEKSNIKIKQRAYWEKIVEQQPQYRDAWVQLFYLAINEENTDQAKMYLEKIKALDPNFVKNLPSIP